MIPGIKKNCKRQNSANFTHLFLNHLIIIIVFFFHHKHIEIRICLIIGRASSDTFFLLNCFDFLATIVFDVKRKVFALVKHFASFYLILLRV